MAGDQHAAAPVLHQRRDRRAAGGVEIVGRLIQQQKVRRLQLQAGNPDPGPLPA